MHSTPSHKCTILYWNQWEGFQIQTYWWFLFTTPTKVVTPGFHKRPFCQKQFSDLRNFFQLLMQRAAGSHAYASLSHGFLHPITPLSTPHAPCLPASEGPLPKGQASLHLEEYLEKPIRQALPHPNFTHMSGGIIASD